MIENIIISCLVFACFLTVFLAIFYFFSIRGTRAKKQYFEKLHVSVLPGKKIIFCSGIYGKIISVKGDKVEVEVLDGTRLEISRYVISEIL